MASMAPKTVVALLPPKNMYFRLAHPAIEESGKKVKEGSRYSKCNTSGGHCYEKGIIPKGIKLVDVNLPTLQTPPTSQCIAW